MAKNSVTRVCRDINALQAPFRPVVRSMVKIAQIYQIQLFVFETHRSDARQAWCYSKGYSKVKTTGKHGKRCAVDFVVKVSGKWRWDDKKDGLKYQIFAFLVKHHLQKKYPHIVISWGFDLWGWDLPHWQFRLKGR